MIPNAEIRAITLDLDDTLWPIRPALIDAERTLGAWLAKRAPRTATLLTPQLRGEIRARVIESNPQRAHDVSFVRRESLRLALQAAGDDPLLAGEAFEVFIAARQRVTLYDDVVPVLGRWAARYRLVAVTNGNADVERIGIGEYFAASISAPRFGFGKPDPRIFLEACRSVGVEPAQALHVGDDLALDVRAAIGAGLQAAWIRRPDIDAGALAQEQADHGHSHFDSLAALDAHLHPPG